MVVVEVDGASTWRGADSRETGTCARASTVTADFSKWTPVATTPTATTTPTMVPMAATGAVIILTWASRASSLVSMRSNLLPISRSAICCWGVARGGAGVVIVVWSGLVEGCAQGVVWGWVSISGG